MKSGLSVFVAELTDGPARVKAMLPMARQCAAEGCTQAALSGASEHTDKQVGKGVVHSGKADVQVLLRKQSSQRTLFLNRIEWNRIEQDRILIFSRILHFLAVNLRNLN